MNSDDKCDGLDDEDDFTAEVPGIHVDHSQSPMELLQRSAQNPPQWLHAISRDQPLNRATLQRFLSCRTVFYPGCAADKQAFDVFGRTRAAYGFVQADYQDVQNHPDGYEYIVHQTLDQEGAVKHLGFELSHPFAQEPRFERAVWSVLERKAAQDDLKPDRLAVLTIVGEAIWAYFNLWVKDARRQSAPFAVILQDHGFGGNWTRFGGAESPLYRLAQSSGLPKWLLVGENTPPWPGYEVASHWAAPAGMHNDLRRLFRCHSGVSR